MLNSINKNRSEIGPENPHRVPLHGEPPPFIGPSGRTRSRRAWWSGLTRNSKAAAVVAPLLLAAVVALAWGVSSVTGGGASQVIAPVDMPEEPAVLFWTSGTVALGHIARELSEVHDGVSAINSRLLSELAKLSAGLVPAPGSPRPPAEVTVSFARLPTVDGGLFAGSGETMEQEQWAPEEEIKSSAARLAAELRPALEDYLTRLARLRDRAQSLDLPGHLSDSSDLLAESCRKLSGATEATLEALAVLEKGDVREADSFIQESSGLSYEAECDLMQAISFMGLRPG